MLSEVWQLESVAKSIMNSPFIGVLIYRENVLYANDYILTLTGFNREELYGKSILELVERVDNQQLKDKIIENIKRRLSGEHGIYIYEDIPFYNKNGELLHLKAFSDTVLYLGEYAGISFFIDNTKKVRIENLYNLLKEINDAITKSSIEEEFFEKVVNALINKIGLSLVWIGKKEEDKIKPIYFGGEGAGYLDNIKIQSLEENCPVNISFTTNRIFINPDSTTFEAVKPWRENLLKFGLLSSVYIPLEKDGKIEYILSMYSNQKNFFQSETEEILYEIKNDIEYFLSEIDEKRKSIIIGEALKSSKSWIVITDESGNITYVNDFVVETSGYSKEELIGKNPRIFKSGYLPKEFYKQMWEKITSGEKFSAVFVNRKKDGSIFYIEGNIYPVRIHGNILRYVSVGKDITKEYEMSSQLNRLKFYDPITGLYNLNGFTFISSEEIKGDNLICLILVDISNFTDINKRYGFKSGDEVLKFLANKLKTNFREKDIIGRISSDEFGILLTGIKNKESIMIVLEKIRNSLKERVRLEDEDIVISINGGIAVYPEDGKNFEELYNKASVALKEAKKDGFGVIRFFNKEIEEKTEKLLFAENLISKAIEKGLFKFFFQPYFNTQDLSIAGFEALVRIVDEDGKVYTPNFFIDYLENSQFLRDFENWALKEAISTSIKWNKIISLNISARSFNDEAFLERLFNIPQESKITYELTERIFLKEPDRVKKFLEMVKEKDNIKIAIDDFGTGYSSLTYIKDITANILKIDISFIRSMMEKPKDRALVKTIIDLASNLGMESLAEGVETEAQYKLLKKMGCTYVQGYLFSKPLPQEELESIYSIREEKLQER